MQKTELLRQIPGVDRLLKHAAAQDLVRSYGHELTVAALRLVLSDVREAVQAGEEIIPMDAVLLQNARDVLLEWVSPTLKRVINATGVIIHTNLGRAPLSDETIAAMNAVAQGYSTLEFDLKSGKRGSRSSHAEALLCRLTGAEAAFVVNNNAAATMLALSALAGPTAAFPEGRGVIVSRGQLVEIGGGYRMPDVMQQSGAHMVEVGTTNRTHLYDYERAIDERSALLIRVHHSNYAITGFTSEPAIEELVELAHAHDLLAVDDIGSGALFDTSVYSLSPEPMVQASIAAGADVVLFSGDKLPGGPQAGVILGRFEVIKLLKQHPLARAVRPDKLCLAGLSATLTHYLKGDALKKIPIWQMISMTVEDINTRAQGWLQELEASGLECVIIDGESTVGGGSLPGEMLPTRLLAIEVGSVEEAAARLRASDPPVIVRREDGHILIDPRTILERDETELLQALKTLAG